MCLWPSALFGQGLKAVMVDTNGVVQRPTNFFAVNAGVVAFRQEVTFANLQTQVDGGSVEVTNSHASGVVSATNSNGIAAVRLIGVANARPLSGVGTEFAADSHTAWFTVQVVGRENGVIRAVLGGNNNSTNVALYPTNIAVGAEITITPGTVSTNRVRLIAHNGSAATNGPWVTLGTWNAKYVIGVQQSKGSDEVKLWVGTNAVPPVINTNGTISGGPTNNAPLFHSAFDIGMFSSNTNTANASYNVFGARVEVTD